MGTGNLDAFLFFSVQVKLVYFAHLQTLTDATLEELKACFMEAYDDNQDGKIDIREVSEWEGSYWG